MKNGEGSKKFSARRFRGRFVTKKNGSRLTKFTREFIGKVGSGGPSLVDVPLDGSGELVFDGHKECTCSDTKLVCFFLGGILPGGSCEDGHVASSTSAFSNFAASGPTSGADDDCVELDSFDEDHRPPPSSHTPAKEEKLESQTDRSGRVLEEVFMGRRIAHESSVSLLKDFSVVATHVGIS